MNTYKKIIEKYGATAWFFVVATLLSLGVMSTVGFDSDGYDEWVTSAVVTIAIILIAAGAISIRYLFTDKNLDPKLPPKSWALVWLLPLAITVVMLPWLLSGVLADDTTPILMSIFLWLCLAYGALLLGFLVVPFVLLPIEMIGTGLLRLATGRHKEAAPLLIIGGYIALVTAFAIVGAFALDDLPTAQAGWLHIIFALLGLPGLYTIENPTLLWVARGMAILLIAIPLAFYMPERRKRRQSQLLGKRAIK